MPPYLEDPLNDTVTEFRREVRQALAAAADGGSDTVSHSNPIFEKGGARPTDMDRLEKEMKMLEKANADLLSALTRVHLKDNTGGKSSHPSNRADDLRRQVEHLHVERDRQQRRLQQHIRGLKDEVSDLEGKKAELAALLEEKHQRHSLRYKEAARQQRQEVHNLQGQLASLQANFDTAEKERVALREKLDRRAARDNKTRAEETLFRWRAAVVALKSKRALVNIQKKPPAPPPPPPRFTPSHSIRAAVLLLRGVCRKRESAACAKAWKRWLCAAREAKKIELELDQKKQHILSSTRMAVRALQRAYKGASRAILARRFAHLRSVTSALSRRAVACRLLGGILRRRWIRVTSTALHAWRSSATTQSSRVVALGRLVARRHKCALVSALHLWRRKAELVTSSKICEARNVTLRLILSRSASRAAIFAVRGAFCAWRCNAACLTKKAKELRRIMTSARHRMLRHALAAWSQRAVVIGLEAAAGAECQYLRDALEQAENDASALSSRSEAEAALRNATGRAASLEEQLRAAVVLVDLQKRQLRTAVEGAADAHDSNLQMRQESGIWRIASCLKAFERRRISRCWRRWAVATRCIAEREKAVRDALENSRRRREMEMLKTVFASWRSSVKEDVQAAQLQVTQQQLLHVLRTKHDSRLKNAVWRVWKARVARTRKGVHAVVSSISRLQRSMLTHSFYHWRAATAEAKTEALLLDRTSREGMIAVASKRETAARSLASLVNRLAMVRRTRKFYIWKEVVRESKAREGSRQSLLRSLIPRLSLHQQRKAWIRWQTATRSQNAADESKRIEALTLSARQQQVTSAGCMLRRVVHGRQQRKLGESWRRWSTAVHRAKASSASLRLLRNVWVSSVNRRRRAAFSQWRLVSANARRLEEGVSKLFRSLSKNALRSAWSSWRAATSSARLTTSRCKSAARALYRALASSATRDLRVALRIWSDETRRLAEKELHSLEGTYHLAATLGWVSRRRNLRHMSRAWSRLLQATSTAKGEQLENIRTKMAVKLLESLLVRHQRRTVRRSWSILTQQGLREKQEQKRLAQLRLQTECGVRRLAAVVGHRHQFTVRNAFGRWWSEVCRQRGSEAEVLRYVNGRERAATALVRLRRKLVLRCVLSKWKALIYDGRQHDACRRAVQISQLHHVMQTYCNRLTAFAWRRWRTEVNDIHTSKQAAVAFAAALSRLQRAKLMRGFRAWVAATALSKVKEVFISFRHETGARAILRISERVSAVRLQRRFAQWKELVLVNKHSATAKVALLRLVTRHLCLRRQRAAWSVWRRSISETSSAEKDAMHELLALSRKQKNLELGASLLRRSLLRRQRRQLALSWGVWQSASAAVTRRASAVRAVYRVLSSAATRDLRVALHVWCTETHRAAERELRALEGSYHMAATLGWVARRRNLRHMSRAWSRLLQAASTAKGEQLENVRTKMAVKLLESLLLRHQRCTVRRYWAVLTQQGAKEKQEQKRLAQSRLQAECGVRRLAAVIAHRNQFTVRNAFGRWWSKVCRQRRYKTVISKLFWSMNRRLLSSTWSSWQRYVLSCKISEYERQLETGTQKLALTRLSMCANSLRGRVTRVYWSRWVDFAKEVAARKSAAAGVILRLVSRSHSVCQRRAFSMLVTNAREASSRELRALEGSFYIVKVLARVLNARSRRLLNRSWTHWRGLFTAHLIAASKRSVPSRVVEAQPLEQIESSTDRTVTPQVECPATSPRKLSNVVEKLVPAQGEDCKEVANSSSEEDEIERLRLVEVQKRERKDALALEEKLEKEKVEAAAAAERQRLDAEQLRLEREKEEGLALAEKIRKDKEALAEQARLEEVGRLAAEAEQLRLESERDVALERGEVVSVEPEPVLVEESEPLNIADADLRQLERETDLAIDIQDDREKVGSRVEVAVVVANLGDAQATESVQVVQQEMKIGEEDQVVVESEPCLAQETQGAQAEPQHRELDVERSQVVPLDRPQEAQRSISADAKQQSDKESRKKGAKVGTAVKTPPTVGPISAVDSDPSKENWDSESSAASTSAAALLPLSRIGATSPSEKTTSKAAARKKGLTAAAHAKAGTQRLRRPANQQELMAQQESKTAAKDLSLLKLEESAAAVAAKAHAQALLAEEQEAARNDVEREEAEMVILTATRAAEAEAQAVIAGEERRRNLQSRVDALVKSRLEEQDGGDYHVDGFADAIEKAEAIKKRVQLGAEAAGVTSRTRSKVLKETTAIGVSAAADRAKREAVRAKALSEASLKAQEKVRLQTVADETAKAEARREWEADVLRQQEEAAAKRVKEEAFCSSIASGGRLRAYKQQQKLRIILAGVVRRGIKAQGEEAEEGQEDKVSLDLKRALSIWRDRVSLNENQQSRPQSPYRENSQRRG